MELCNKPRIMSEGVVFIMLEQLFTYPCLKSTDVI